MTVKEAFNYISDEFKVDFADVVPFYNFSRDDFAHYYASLINTIFPTKVEKIKVMNTGIDGTYAINLNNDKKHRIFVTGLDTEERVLENIEDMNNILLNREVPYSKPAYKPEITIDERGIRIMEYYGKVHREYENLLNDLYSSPIYDYIISGSEDNGLEM